MQKKQLREYKPCKMLFCSFVPFQTGVKPRKKQTPFGSKCVCSAVVAPDGTFMWPCDQVRPETLMPFVPGPKPSTETAALVTLCCTGVNRIGWRQKKTCDLRQSVFNLTENDSENQQVRFSIFHDGLLLPSSINKSEHAFCGGGRFWGPTIACIYTYISMKSQHLRHYIVLQLFSSILVQSTFRCHSREGSKGSHSHGWPNRLITY